MGIIQRVELHLAVCALRVLLVAPVEFENRVRAKPVFSGYSDDKRIDFLLQFFNRAAVDAQFGGQTVAIDSLFICVKKFPHAALYNQAAFRPLGDFHDRPLQEIPDSIDERIIIDDVRDFRRADGQRVRDAELLRFLKIRRSRKADDGVDRAVLRPFADDGAELYLVAYGVVHLVNEDGERWQFTDEVAKLVRLPVLLVVALLKQDLAVPLLNAVKYDFLRVRDRHQPEKFGERLMARYFLYVRVLCPVRFAGGLSLVKNLKGNHAPDVARRRLRQNPRGIEVLYGSEARNDGRFEARRREDDEVVGKCAVRRLIGGKIQIKIDERRHQVGFARAHGQAEQIIRI